MVNIKLLLSTVLLLAYLRGLEAADACAPSCLKADVGDHVPVRWDCSLYAVCQDLYSLDGSGELLPSEPVACPKGFYFSQNDRECSEIANATLDCINSCEPCKPYWGTLGEVTPHPTDCGQYYISVGDDSFNAVTCPDVTPYYDYINGHCTTDDSHCFHYCDPCGLYCESNERIPDPYDCTAFYQCEAPSMARFQCPPNVNFDRESSVCSATVECIQDC